MKILLKKPWVVFGLMSFILALLFFTLPINLFDGIIVQQNGLQELEVEAPLSLSYFIGLGYEEGELVDRGIVDFYLTTRGYIVAGILMFGIPGLFAYRMHLKASMAEDKKEK
jgi:hypothetical protein